MRYAIIVNRYPPLQGGVEFHAQNLASSLNSLGHKVWVLTIGEHPDQRNDDGVRVLVSKSCCPIADVISFPTIGATGRIASFLETNRIDVVSVHTRFFPMTFVGLRAAKKAHIPVIHTEHGSDYVSSASPLISAGSRMVDMTIGRYVLRSANKVLAVSENAAIFAQRLGARDVNVFYNAITPPKSTGEHTDHPRRLVFVGRMVEGKGWDVFLDAIARLTAEGIRVEGELLGGGLQLEKARHRVTELGLDSTVTVRGRVSPERVRESLAGATLVNPTTLSEGFQTTLLESLAEGGRIVTYDVPGASVLAAQGHPVMICTERSVGAVADTLKHLFSDPPAQSDTAMMSEWTWPVRARQYADIAAEVVATYRAARR